MNPNKVKINFFWCDLQHITGMSIDYDKNQIWLSLHGGDMLVFNIDDKNLSLEEAEDIIKRWRML